ncbi:hypothetical protein GDO78_007672 [Eleutherodactylus coqui]|uniref:Uncharacterized protein n=1 Tax=Eleutherodactylus coqui TaxID=57060 RepID=A0A8J6FHI9_ELECQ|nr:hypothetical protein GDO78_007672 [Eleutherodactylus coqui]
MKWGDSLIHSLQLSQVVAVKRFTVGSHLSMYYLVIKSTCLYCFVNCPFHCEFFFWYVVCMLCNCGRVYIRLSSRLFSLVNANRFKHAIDSKVIWFLV